MQTPFWRRWSGQRGDEEAKTSSPTQPGALGVYLNDSDDRWVIDLNIDNIISKIITSPVDENSGQTALEQAS